MRIRITSPTGYHDRFGHDHAFRAVINLPDRISAKLIRHSIAEFVGEEPKPPKPKPRGRPRKKKEVSNGSD